MFRNEEYSAFLNISILLVLLYPYFDLYYIRSEQVLGKLGWKTLEEMREKTKYMSKVIEGGCSEILSNLFEKCNNEKYNLRSNGNS